ncbi:MAG: DUF6492 family protein [Oculatellaceae cyanobacterium Prado106]|nr:DUF6492 family protein [Oculatellaceae cyanobacterium Prado106]
MSIWLCIGKQKELEYKTMSDFTFAFITPSYAPDFQRCKLLHWSIKQFVCFPVKHYIVVDQQDLIQFQELADAHTIILTKQQILPSWIQQIPLRTNKNIWLNLKGYQSGHWILRGWLIQQLIKLAAAQYVTEDVLVFIDSDVAFINPFDVNMLVDGDRVRLFRVEHSTNLDDAVSQKWKDTAKRLLKLPSNNNYYDFYINQLITWKRENLIKLYTLLGQGFGKGWLEVIASANHLSEYVLYGIFASYVLGEKSGHYDDHLQKICHCYWGTVPLAEPELQQFIQEAQSSGHRAVMISAKSSIELTIEQFQALLPSKIALSKLEYPN